LGEVLDWFEFFVVFVQGNHFKVKGFEKLFILKLILISETLFQKNLVHSSDSNFHWRSLDVSVYEVIQYFHIIRGSRLLLF
jgi:hypothetical protein